MPGTLKDQPFTQIRPEYESDGTLRYVPITNEFAVPRRFIASNDSLSVRIEVDDAGQAHCDAVEIRGQQLTSADLRLPLARLIRQAVAGAAVALTIGSAGPVDAGAVVFGLARRGERERDFYRRYVNDTDRPRRGRTVTDEHLQRVADVYRAAVEHGDPPTRTIADTMHASRATAGRWVTQARKRGLLGAAVHGKVGEFGGAS